MPFVLNAVIGYILRRIFLSKNNVTFSPLNILVNRAKHNFGYLSFHNMRW
jgi:hypothetical protein